MFQRKAYNIGQNNIIDIDDDSYWWTNDLASPSYQCYAVRY